MLPRLVFEIIACSGAYVLLRYLKGRRLRRQEKLVRQNLVAAERLLSYAEAFKDASSHRLLTQIHREMEAAANELRKNPRELLSTETMVFLLNRNRDLRRVYEERSWQMEPRSFEELYLFAVKADARADVPGVHRHGDGM